MSFSKELFAFQGTLDKTRAFTRLFLTTLIAGLVGSTAGYIGKFKSNQLLWWALELAFVAVLITAAWINLATIRKRLRAAGRSPWWIFLILIPRAGGIVLLVLLFALKDSKS